jgi:aminobenzoyl-glutamate utilization protein B
MRFPAGAKRARRRAIEPIQPGEQKPMTPRTGRYLAAAALIVLLPATARAANDDEKKFANSVVEKNAQTIYDIADSLYYFGELGMQETESTKLLKDTLEAAGFNVDLGAAGMPTDLWAKWGSGHPYIVIETEIDALPGGSQTPNEFTHKPLVDGAPGHMEGHNTHGGVASAAAFAVKQVMERDHLPGTVAVNFGPAEEELASRPFIVRAGYFKDVDAVIYLHIGDNFSTGWGLQNYAAISTRFTFHGKTAHGAVDPWDGKDALDAIELMDVGVSFLREQLHPSYRVHRSITNGGIQPNIIPDLAQIWYFVRDKSMPEAKETYDKLVNIAQGAELMTGTTHTVDYDASAWPQLSNKALAEVVQKNIDAVGLPAWSDDEQKYARDFQAALNVKVQGLFTTPVALGTKPQSASSNDSGDISWVVPAVVYTFPASVPGIQYHNWQAGVTPTTSIAHKGEIAGAKALAGSILDFMTSPELLKAAHDEWAQQTHDTPYFSVIPDNATPQIGMNAETMAKYRPAMSKFYLHKTPRYN